MTTNSASRSVAVRTTLLLMTAFSLAVGAGPSLSEVACPSVAEKGAGTLVAEFTGEFDRGAPVYRLPPVSVSVSRSLAVAEARAQKRDARIQAARARSAS
ncbi:MAG TPA: hypothetical protein VFF44_07210 [Casimicrobiaceae bacterium]|nr:hypothetical protein [Casimicrobiaceae bacterium]